ncbi:MAG: hypothetical protein AAGE52_35835 [Myxococcota bacterium]
MRSLVVFLVVVVGCGDDSSRSDAAVDAAGDTAGEDIGADDAGPYRVPEGCNPLGADWDCMLPFPSDVFLEDDDTLPSGRRVVIPEPARLRFRREPSDMLSVHEADGFSVAAPIIAWFPEEVDGTPLIGIDEDVAMSTTASSPTLLIDTETGEAVVHIAELDPPELDPTESALLIRPLAPLVHERRYVVAIRGLRNAEGAPLRPPEGFRQIRDNDVEDASVINLGERYARDVFPVLADAGVARDELLLAWDFTTGSQARATGDMERMRTLVLEELERTPPIVTVQEVIDDPEALGEIADDIAFQVEASVRVPSVLTDANPETARLFRDEAGAVALNGTVDAPVTILIPKNVAEREEGAAPARLIQYGHGFFGGRDEIVRGFADQFANDRGFVLVAADWWGMMRDDQVVVANRLSDGNADDVGFFVDRVHQGMANFLAVAHAASAIASLDELQIGGAPAFDPGEVYFYGNSQGHILGGTYAALSPDIERFALGVGGANFSFIMFRSRAFLALRFLIDANVSEPVDRQKFGVLLQMVLDRIDPFLYADRVFRNPYEGSPERRILMQVGIADPSVSSLSAELHARTLGLPVVADSPRVGALLETAETPTESALQIFDFGFTEEPRALAPPDNEVHEGVRRLEAGQAQIDAFFRPDGQVMSTCDGVCDPE